MAISKKNNISAMILQSGINPMTGDYLSAKEFCKDRQWEFKIITENELGIK